MCGWAQYTPISLHKTRFPIIPILTQTYPYKPTPNHSSFTPPLKYRPQFFYITGMQKNTIWHNETTSSLSAGLTARLWVIFYKTTPLPRCLFLSLSFVFVFFTNFFIFIFRVARVEAQGRAEGRPHGTHSTCRPTTPGQPPQRL